MLPLFGKLCPSVRQAFRDSGSIVRVLRQAFRSPGSIVRASDRAFFPEKASSEYSDSAFSSEEASSDYSRLMTSAGFSCAARQTRQLILNPTTNNKTRKTPNTGAIGIGIWRV